MTQDIKGYTGYTVLLRVNMGTQDIWGYTGYTGYIRVCGSVYLLRETTMNLCPNLSYYRILMNNRIVRIVNLRSVRFSAANKLFCKCFTKIYRTLSGDSMFVPI